MSCLTLTTATLTNAMFKLGKPVVMILYGGRPFAVPKYYTKAAAVLQAVCHSLRRTSLFLNHVLAIFRAIGWTGSR
jgi:hypothetical protein